MTESPALITTTSIPNPFPVAAVPSHQSPIPNGALSDNNAQDEEEYTIKCICGYADDDGNTVYCPKCDTWQHIECYYPSKKVPEDHFCSDCMPRELDAKRAAERQRRHREALDGSDRKVKRPTSKGQKKKHKDSIVTAEQVNGWHTHERHDSLTNGRDQPPPAKKPKTSHRASGSIASLNGESRKRASSNIQSYPSPSKSPQDHLRYPPIPMYTSEFLELYERDEGSTSASDNEHTLRATNMFSDWRDDPSRIVGVGEQPTQHAPFVRPTHPVNDAAFPEVSLETTQKKEMEIDGRIPQWKYIKTQTSIRKDDLVGEIRGEVGMLDEYCQQQSSSNRWQELGHPDPFVFFHPHMNIYIDSRKAGTQFRYLRRSCTPNVTLKTFLSEEGHWRHCFVAREDIPAGKELTAAWFLDPEMLLNADTRSEQEDPPYSRQCDWVSRVLANFGDCACSKGAACHFARFDRRQQSRSSDPPPKSKPPHKKPKKSKNAISPLSTGQATNSRAGSEALKQEDEDQDDRQSSSGSSDPKSRDMTPVNVAALDAPPVIDGQLTERERRKIKNLEKLFEQQTQQKKKKRTSGGSNLNTPNANSMKQAGQSVSPLQGPPTGDGSPQLRGHSSQKSRSKLTQQTPSRPAYTSTATQTDPEDGDFELPPRKRQKFMTSTQRLLRRVFADRARHEQQCKMGLSPPGPTVMSIGSTDVEMKDAGSGLSPVSVKSAPLPSPSSSSDANTGPSPVQSPIYPLPSQAAHSHKQFKVPPAPKLQLSTLPPVPTFPLAGVSSIASTTPTVATPLTTQSPSAALPGPGLFPPISNVLTPSPAKKKMSLGDYMMARRNTSSGTTPSADKAQPQATARGDGNRRASDGSPVSPQEAVPRPKLDQAVKQEAAASGGLQGSAIDDTVMKDDAEEPEYSPPEPVDTSSEPPKADAASALSPTPTENLSPEVSNILAMLSQYKARTQSAGS